MVFHCVLTKFMSGQQYAGADPFHGKLPVRDQVIKGALAGTISASQLM
jgi:hypothetical protein